MSWTVDSLAYDNRKKITVQNVNVDSDLTDFPLLVDITSDSDIGAVSNADGFDHRFTESDGITLLKYERESFSISDGVANGFYWVKTDISSVSGATIYLYYRSADTADGADPANVWDANYRAVYHLKETGTETYGDYKDSTANAFNSTSTTHQPDQTASGMVNGAQAFTRANADYINLKASSTMLPPTQTGATISAWVKNTSLTNDERIFGLFNGGNSKFAILMGRTDNKASVFLRNSANALIQLDSDTNYTTGDWYHLTATAEASSGILYQNGASVGTSASVDVTKTLNDFNTQVAMIGLNSGGSTTTAFDWTIDEVRLSDIVRSAAWIKFEYYNISNADSELTWGTEEGGTYNGINFIISS